MGSNQLADSRDIRFLLFEMLDAPSLLKFEKFKEFDKETFESILELAETIATEKFYDANIKGDALGATYDGQTKQVKVPPSYHAPWQAYVEAGFPSLIASPEWGGMGMPELVWKACLEYIQAASVPLSMYSTLAIGAYQLIEKYGSDELKETYLENMVQGKWGGTMCLTEPHAGSDVGALTTKAVKQEDGTYLITGNKIFISAGEHDLTENIIHTVLARIEGDPEGTKGISIFAVPKIHVNKDKSLGKPNDVYCSGIEHKMGITGSSTCSLTFGDNNACVGYLLGEERQGMSIMFGMMNSARIEVALQGQSTASAAYMHSISYAKNRVQSKNPAKKSGKGVPIIQHPDVKRMLLWMKSYCEAMRALTYLAALQYDLTENADGKEKEDAQALLDFIIPICKAGNTDNAWLITAEAIQIFGGYGYCREYPVEQMARDSKIFSLYEGTNGIQSLDLLMRKLLMNPDMKNYQVFKEHIKNSLKKVEDDLPKEYAAIVQGGMAKMDEIIGYLGKELKAGKVEKVLAQAVPLQKCFKLLCYAWMHAWSLGHCLPKVKELLQDAKGEELSSILEKNSEAAYYQGRARSARFFLKTEFKHFDGQAAYILSDDEEVWQTLEGEFTGAL